MQFWVYLLRCADGSYYAGHTDDLETRFAHHQSGLGCNHTRRRLPVELVWAQETSSREEALAFERRIKGWNRAKKEALIADDWDKLRVLSALCTSRPSTSLGAGPSTSLRANEVGE
jgi:predicted GIY-YIG superfamily endonuclease